MESGGVWRRLPEEIQERVLSFLPLPALCRCRSVCRDWNNISRTRRFLELNDENTATKPYLFLTRHLGTDVHGDGWSAVDDAHRQTTCFLDLEDRRWYSIPSTNTTLPNEDILRLLAVDGGLFFELASLQESYKLAVYDPVAKTRRELPESAVDGGRVVCRVGETDPNVDALPVIVTVVERASCSFKVFCMNRDVTGLHGGFYVYESATDAWRSLGTPPERIGLGENYTSGRVLEESAVFFQGELYAVFWYDDSNKNVVLRYSLEEDVWREVLVVDAENPKYPQLMVYGDRMFMALWNIPFLSSPSIRPRVRDAFEVIEVLVEEKASRLVVEIASEELERISGESQFDITYGFPLTSSCGDCERKQEIVLISRRTGRLLTYDVRSGAVGALPAHPLQLPEQFVLELEEHNLFPHYRARISNLSLRNVLSIR